MRIRRLLEATITPRVEALKLQAGLIDLGWDDVEIDNGSDSIYGSKTIVVTAKRGYDAIPPDVPKINLHLKRRSNLLAREVKVVGYIDTADKSMHGLDDFYWESHDSEEGEFEGLSTDEMLEELKRLYGSS